MTLGYREHPEWSDMSEYAVHFTKDTPDQSAYSVMMKILWSGRLEARGKFGAAKNLTSPPLPTFTQQAACFSEIPLDRLDRLVERRSQYGIGFHQEFLIKAGGGRVWYVEKASQVAASVKHLIDIGKGPPFEKDHPIWEVTPFVDFPGEYNGTPYRFEWEREWRVPRNMPFAPDDVDFLFIPEHLHDAAQTFFLDHERENTGPAYSCPFLDPLWSEEQIQKALAGRVV